MIVDRPELQAYQCSDCGELVELRRSSGSEREMNLAIDLKRSLEVLHEECGTKKASKAA